MDEFSLYVLDITMNSVRAGAENIDVSLREEGEWLYFTVTDNGCGMSAEQVRKLSDPFFTTRKTRKVGLGIPFLTMLAEMTGGHVTIRSTPAVNEETGAPNPDHGTVVESVFGRNHLDFIPLGDMVETVKTLIQGSPDVNFTYTHEMPGGKVELSCAQLKAMLGDEIPLSTPEILNWIGGYLAEQYAEAEGN